MFRIAIEKHNQLMNMIVNFIFSRNETNDVRTIRRYYRLETEWSNVLFLPIA
ncbi:hypothetical protein [uncultured Arcticibacterium sp.]|uniref:hypothetical protein n=1 Tax=uncultured Arcticibacterium sp. TaxID=2173042 RepID=UPI0030F5733E